MNYSRGLHAVSDTVGGRAIRRNQQTKVSVESVGGPDLKDAIADDLGSLLDRLHLLANAGSRRFVAALGLIDIRFDLGDQLLQIFIFLH